jgi:hypothetical protein
MPNESSSALTIRSSSPTSAPIAQTSCPEGFVALPLTSGCWGLKPTWRYEGMPGPSGGNSL